MDAPANEEPHFKWLAVLTRLTILTEQRKIKTISFIQHLKPVASNMTATQEKILQDFFTTKPENRMVTAAPPPPHTLLHCKGSTQPYWNQWKFYLFASAKNLAATKELVCFAFS